MAAPRESVPLQSSDDMFQTIRPAIVGTVPRLGRLTLAGRKTIDTPHYIGITSRGVIPHITQDTFDRSTSLVGINVNFEDFIERAPQRTPPILKTPPSDTRSPLRQFIALPDTALLVLGIRRTPPLIAPAATSNTNTTVAVSTSVGFRFLSAQDYAEQAENLGADIVVGLADIPYGRTLAPKRIEKATDRSIEWLQQHVDFREQKNHETPSRLFASLLPVACSNQQHYIDSITEKSSGCIEGLAIYDLDTLLDLPTCLDPLPRLGYTEPSNPHQILQHLQRGIDLFTIPFIGAATDAGIALSFQFPRPDGLTGDTLPLGIDMWCSSHATDLSPLQRDCSCYACTEHHRAYVQHLLSAKEMLGWVLLQIHNHHVLDSFFAAVRKSITAANLSADAATFAATYQPTLPEKTGQGPRVRGYQYRSQGPGEAKKNTAPFTAYSEARHMHEDGLVTPEGQIMSEEGL